MNKPTIQVSELRRLGTFDWLSPDRLDLLSRNMEELRVAKGQAIYRSDEPAKQLFYVLEGLIAVSLLGSEGRFVRLTVVTPGEFFGITALVRGWRRLSTATALRDSRVGRIESHVFVKEVCGLPWELFGGLMDTSLRPVLKLSLLRAMFLGENLSDRLALALWEYAGRPHIRRTKGLFPSALTHEELAAMVGASRPRVSHALKQLERQGLFSKRGNRVRVHEKSLRAYLESRYGLVL